MFHLELRQFPHVARAFNLTREELDQRFARLWASGAEVQHNDRSWTPGKATLTIYEGPELGLEEIGLGRGWATVGKTSQEVTESVLAEVGRGVEGRITLETFKATLRGAARTPMTFVDVIGLAAREFPRSRPSEQLGLAEQAVWELLHQGRIVLRGPDGDLTPEAWPAIVLSWATWTGDEADELVLEAEI